MLESFSDRIKPTFVDIILPLEQSEDSKAQKAAVAAKLNTKISQIVELRLRKHSIDARQRKIKVQLRLEVGIDELLAPEPELQFKYLTVSPDANNVLIVGCGPAGLFAALRCLELGLKPMILERGKDASSRRFDLGPILKEGRVIEDSNYCFGEGGAGTFSDGKLYTRATKRGPVRKIYETLVAHGAPERILIDAHPHIGSNLLPKVVMAMRESIRNAGGEVHFNTKVESFIIHEQKMAEYYRWSRVFEWACHPSDRSLSARHLRAITHTKSATRANTLCSRCKDRASASSDRQPSIPYTSRSRAPCPIARC